MRLELQLRAYAPHRIDTFPSDSDSGTMRKVLNWGVVPLNLKWQGMVVHGLSWARINSPENIRRFNSKPFIILCHEAKTFHFSNGHYEGPIDFFDQSF